MFAGEAVYGRGGVRLPRAPDAVIASPSRPSLRVVVVVHCNRFSMDVAARLKNWYSI